MHILEPVIVDDTVLTSTNVAENDYSEWVSSTSYSVGDKVIVIATHKIYESLVSSNSNNYPPDNTSGTAPAWLEYSATNAWKMFDLITGSKTVNSGTIEVEVVSSNATKVSLLSLDALSVNVTLTDSVDGEVFNEDIALLSTANVFDGFTYFFSPFIKTENVVVDLPAVYLASSLKVTITADSSEDAECGTMAFGQATFLGCTEMGASVGITDYSIKEANDFGEYTILERSFSKRGSFITKVPNDILDGVISTLSMYRATPAVWIPTEDSSLKSPLIIYGFYKDFDIAVRYPSESICSIEIEGLT